MTDHAFAAAALPDTAELARLRRMMRPTLGEWLLAMIPWFLVLFALWGGAVSLLSSGLGRWDSGVSNWPLAAIALIVTVGLPWRAYARARKGDELAMPSLLMTTAFFVVIVMIFFVR